MFSRAARLTTILATHRRSHLGLTRLLTSTVTRETVAQPAKESLEPQLDSPIAESHQVDGDSAPYSQFVEPSPIQSLNILSKVETMDKPGSIFNKYFLAICDTDLLNYPFLLKTRKEFLTMNQQYEMIQNTFHKIQKSEETLDLLGYNSLYKLSVSEMMFIFEAMGASVQKQFSFGTREDKQIRYEKKMSKSFNVVSSTNRFQIPEVAFQSFENTQMTLSTVVPLIVRNCLVYNAICKSSNEKLKQILLNEKYKIGLALSEPALAQSSEYLNWKTEASMTLDFKSWIVSGEKCKIIKDDYSHYLIFCKTNDFQEMQPFNLEKQTDGIVALLLPADQVKVEDEGCDYFGTEFQTIKLEDVRLSRESSEVLKASKDITGFVNLKGCGQLATSALILGMMKQLLKNTYAHLLHEKLGLANCELVQYKLYQATAKIYSLESVLYMTAAMFDSFEPGNNLEGESITAKTLAIDYGYSICHEMRSIFGSRYPFSSTTLDLVYSLDSFLDSSYPNRIRLGENALKEYQEDNKFNLDKLRLGLRTTVHSVKYYLKYRKLAKGSDYLTREMTKFVHPNLQAPCEWIESCLNRLEYTSHIITSENKDYLQRHNDLTRMANTGMDIFMMISVLSRANHSLCYGFRNNHTEKEICLAICKETFLKHLQFFEDMSQETFSSTDSHAKSICAQNLKENGYFASLFRM